MLSHSVDIRIVLVVSLDTGSDVKGGYELRVLQT